MQTPLGIATVLCLTAGLLVGCACGLPKPKERALDNFASGAGTGALAAQVSSRTAENFGAQPEQSEPLKRAAVFHDYGRYYK